MGVTGLWKLIEPCGTPVPVETLEGKVLAVDISIWLHQVIKGFQDNKGSALVHAHLLGLFHRLCKLLYYRVRPVFVFDGSVPQLKRDTIAQRQLQRSKLSSEADRIQALLLQSLAKEKVVQQALGANVELLLKSPAKRADDKAKKAESAIDDIFKLPPLPEGAEIGQAGGKGKDDDSWQESSANSSYTDDTSSTDDSSFDQSNLRSAYNANLQAVDVRSSHFRNLPAEVRHEILVDIKETRKQSSWGRLHELPSRSDDFSTFQMKRLLKRRAVQESLEEVEQEMGSTTLTYAELKDFFTEEGIVEPTAVQKASSKQICSDENTRFLLVRGLKKKLTEVKEVKEDQEVTTNLKEEKLQNNVLKEEVLKAFTSKIANAERIENVMLAEKELQPSTSKMANIENPIEKSELPVSEEFDADLELALAMSLEDSCVYNQKDYDYDSDENLKLNREQRKQLKNSAVGPARAYMMEYAGMNVEEVAGIMDKTQMSEFGDITDIAESVNPVETVIVDEEDIAVGGGESPMPRLHVDTDSDTDTDLEEVVEAEPVLEIRLDLQQPIEARDDLFANIFEEKVEIESNESDNSASATTTSANTEKDKTAELELHTVKSTSSKLSLPSTSIDSTNALSILEQLKQEVTNVKHIKLSDVKVDTTSNIIEVSDEEPMEVPKIMTPTTEIIEICDDDNAPKAISKSPGLRTPSKISAYFEPDYVIKRTPEKCPATEEEQNTPKVKSPFFVNKNTPKSGRKRGATNSDNKSPTPPGAKKTEQSSKAAKSLFGPGDDEQAVEQAALPMQTIEGIVAEGASILREQKSTAELQTLAKDLAAERRQLESERNRQDRMGMSVNQRMVSECQELLQLFGIPYIVAPMEAEAQCAFLDIAGLTNGTITDDSDIWLFGGHTVYKNFFAQDKHVLEFRAEQIEKSFSCDRKSLIQLACLVGSDYTTGIHGIGAVTALEIIASFAASRGHGSKEENNLQIATVLSTLERFRDWWVAHKNAAAPPGSSARLGLMKKLKNIELHERFPSYAVVEAYLTPKVDESRNAFSWGQPDVQTIYEFTRKNFGWTKSKTEDILTPVLKKVNEKKSQASIRNYFTVKSALSVRQLQVSKRVQSAINKLGGVEEEPNEQTESTAKRAAAGKKRAKRKATAPESPNAASLSTLLPPPSLATVTTTTAKRAVRIPNTKEVIPQREKTRQQLLENNKKAAGLLKKPATRKTKKT